MNRLRPKTATATLPWAQQCKGDRAAGIGVTGAVGIGGIVAREDQAETRTLSERFLKVKDSPAKVGLLFCQFDDIN